MERHRCELHGLQLCDIVRRLLEQTANATLMRVVLLVMGWASSSG